MTIRIPALDGLRGIAILLVMMTHYIGYEAWGIIDRVVTKIEHIGWVGVDVFFVLSGFLITGILLDARAKAPAFRSYLSRFFSRRALRIFPLYYLLVLALFVTALFVLPSSAESETWWDSQIYYWTYTVNFLIAGGGSFGAAPFYSGHLWSLAIEEQFYLIWPFVVWALTTRRLAALCLVLMATCLLLRIGFRMGDADPVAIFVMTPTRIDTLVAGALVACLVRLDITTATLLRGGHYAIAAGAIGFTIALAEQQDTQQYSAVMQTLGYSSMAVLVGGVILHTLYASGASLVNRVLHAEWLRFFGAYSYALYMIHGYMFYLVGMFFPNINHLPPIAGTLLPWALLKALIAGMLAVAVALLSWNWIERRFLSLKPNEGDAPIRVAQATPQ